MAGARDQALLLLTAANNHGHLAVKLSSLKQAKDILLSVSPSDAAELLPYLAELQFSPETLVRKYLLELIDEIGAKTIEHLSLLLPVLLTLLRDNNPAVAKQSIISGTKFFCIILEELAFQFQRRGIVERWLEELWTWMIKFRDAVLGIIFEAGPVGPKLLGIKFLETYVLQFTVDPNESGTYIDEVMTRPGSGFNVSWIIDGHPVLDIPALVSDANKYIAILLDMLRPTVNFQDLLTISSVNSLAAIARKRPVHYKSVFSALLEFNPYLEKDKGGHVASMQYSLRTAFLGFLRCTHPFDAESRERLLKALRSMDAGDAADQVIRQIDKIMRKNERASQDMLSSKDDRQVSHQSYTSGDVARKMSGDQSNSLDVNTKRFRSCPHKDPSIPVESNDIGSDHVNGIFPKVPALDADLTPVEQMIAMIGALVAEGERGVESLEILISNIHPDLLADIVIINMKHLPKNPPPLTRYDNLSLNHTDDSSSDPDLAVAANGSAAPTQSLGLAAQVPNTPSLPFSEMSTSASRSTDFKRDPRRDPRRLDPRRGVASVNVQPTFVGEDSASLLQPDIDPSSSASTLLPPLVSTFETLPVPLMPKAETDLYLFKTPVTSEAAQPTPEDEFQDMEVKELIPDRDTSNSLHSLPSSVIKVEDIVAEASLGIAISDDAYSPPSQEADQLAPDLSHVDLSEIGSTELPALPLYVELADDVQENFSKESLRRIINSCQNSERTEFKLTQMALVARLFAQTDVDDVVEMVQRRILLDYEQQKGHELVMHILYHLHSTMISDSLSSASAIYEKFLLGVANSLLDKLPASDKSFSRLLGEVPHIPDSALRLLHDICSESRSGSDGRDGDRVTQGLGALWSLILGRPIHRQACLDIVLKCAIHSKDEVRAKAIRLVSNKLYMISFISDNVEQFATNMFLSAIDQPVSNTALSVLVSEKRVGGQVEIQDTSTSGLQISENDMKGAQAESPSDSTISFSEAQALVSLFFSLCPKKPTLLQFVFENYARSPKAVKQVVHRHIPPLIRTLESSNSELLHIVSNPSQGSEQLLIQVLHVLCEGKAPPPDLVATVKHLYETWLKDATILIPVLSAFSRDEVLPIFPKLVDLPLDKFQTALAHILQGSAHMGPALTPVEVLVAIHDISPERDGIPLKKITEACSACFEQRTVFTHQVLAKALDELVCRTPIPLLFMRTVIQAIDAFPTLVNFVMEMLLKAVQRQIWRMPKLWVGFLKCISQTQPHSFHVLLQLPPAQLESALNKYPNLRGPLTAYANQSSIRTYLPRSTLAVLGLASLEAPPPHTAAAASSSVPTSSVGDGATFTT